MVLDHLRVAVTPQDPAELPDGELLRLYVRQRDEAAFAALVRRHGPMVMGLCRRVLRHAHDAEDAFQATFLLLLRKASTLRVPGTVGNWLYGVAYRTALEARKAAARRRLKEAQVVPRTETREDPGSDLRPELDRELERLPEKYRAVLVLCDLEGKTRKEAARHLGRPEGTVASRLAAARTLLARGLSRRGITIPAGGVAALLAQNASAALPAALVTSTVQVAAGFAAGAASARVAAVTEGVLRAMLMTKVKTVLGVGLVVALLLLGSVFGYRSLAADRTPPAPPKDRLEDTLILLDKQWWEAASKNDVETLGKILADDYVSVDRGLWPSPDGQRYTKAAMLEIYRGWRFTEVKFVREREVFRIDEHTAMMTYEVEWKADDRRPSGHGPSSGHNRHVRCWVQRDGGWFLKHVECVTLPVPPEAPPGPTIGPVPPDLKFPPTILVPPHSSKPEPAWKRGVRASGSWQTETPEKAFDCSYLTDWNAGDYAPAWIERDLGASRPLSSITLFPCQDVPGVTVHEVWVSDEPIGEDRAKARLVHTFKGHTTNKQVLKFDFPKDLSARYVEVRTTTSPTWIAWWEIEIRVRDEKIVLLDPEAEPKQPADDRAALQGTWQVVSIESGGKEERGPRLDRERQRRWVVRDGSITFQSEDGAPGPAGEVFTIRPEKTPKEIDINQDSVGDFAKPDVMKGIYTLDGDVWKVCLRRAPEGSPAKDFTERPTEITTKEGSTNVVVTLKRVKP
jgi:RNA polymerase sigma factor (sigma-70 family)